MWANYRDQEKTYAQAAARMKPNHKKLMRRVIFELRSVSA